MRALPPGSYIVRAKVTSGKEGIGEVRRAFAVKEAPRVVAGTGGAVPTVAGRPSGVRPVARLPISAAPPFALDQVLAAPVLGVFLDRVAERPDAAAAPVRDLLDRARTKGPGGLVVTDAEAAAAPGAFLKGLSLLADRKLEPAAAAFREAMRVSADFYPAMIYLGACYAAGGRDKEAAAVWRTALIREGETPALHVMLGDALLRDGRGDLAIDDLRESHLKWPNDLALKRRFAVAALVAGQELDGLKAMDELIEQHADDENSLGLALLVLYEAFGDGQPIESVEADRVRMRRLAEAYRARGGPSMALVDAWLAVAAAKD